MSKIKENKIVKKILAIVLLLLTLFSTTQPVFAASGSGQWVGGQYASGMFTTDSSNGGSGVLIRRLINYKTGERLTVFCAEHGVDFDTGTIYNGEYYTPTNSTIRKACKIAYCGWYSKYGDYTVDGGILAADMIWVKYAYVFTQQYIWETLGQSNATFIDSDIQSQYIAYKAEIDQTIANMEKKPSFSGTTITIQAGETKTITDSNGVLNQYNSIDKTVDGIRFVHNKGDNSMTITVSEDCSIENYRISDDTMKSWGLIKDGTQDNDTTIYFSFSNGIQNQLYSMHYNDPISMHLTLNIEQFGKLELTKLNTNGDLVNGAIFNVTGVKGFNKDVTVTDGKITLEKLKKGTYYIKEKSSPEGYLLNTETYKSEVKPNETTTQAIVNDEPVGEITIIKTDIETGNQNRIDGTSHHGDASIKGAVYTLYAKEDIYNVAKTVKYFSKDEAIATYTFDEYGVASVKIINNSTPAKISIDGNKVTGLPMGKYYAKETVVPKGYTQDTKIYDFILSYKDSKTKTVEVGGTVTNTVEKAPFEVIKVTTNNNTIAETVQGAEFTAILSKYVKYYGSFDEALKHLDEYAEDEYSIFKTGNDGHGISGLLAYGEYTVNETYTPSSEIETVEEFYVTIDKNSKEPIKELVANDLPFEAYIKMQKKDKETGKLVTYSNATFELYKLNEETNKWEQVNCKVGDNYYKSWTTNKEGVAKTETKLEAGNYKVTEIKVPTGFVQLDKELTFKVDNRNSTLNYDKDYDAWITVTAENSQPTGTLKLNKKVNLREDVDKSILKEIDFTKISFELVASENIIDYADGTIIYEKGQVINKYNLKEDGTLTVEDLPMGHYYIKELTTIDGAVLDETKHDIIFEQKDTITKEYIVDKDLENKTTCIEISKNDITGEKELVGAKLTVTDENNEIIDSWVSTEKTHKIEGLEVGKTYTLTEEIAPDGYVKATSVKFTVENTSEIQKVTMIDKVVEITKTDLVTGEEIEGAELEVVDKETGETVDKWTSTKEPHKVIGLEENKSYILKETTAPYGYEITEEIEFTVSENKETQKIEMKDMPILQDIKLVKIDSNTKEIIKEKFTFGIYEDEECTKLIKEVKSNKEDGTVLFEDLRYGTYYIKEITAPKGYVLSDKVIKVEMNDKGTFIDNEKIESENSLYTFEFENTPVDTPKTGDDSNLKLYASLIGLSILGLVCVGVHKYKKRKTVNKK